MTISNAGMGCKHAEHWPGVPNNLKVKIPVLVLLMLSYLMFSQYYFQFSIIHKFRACLESYLIMICNILTASCERLINGNAGGNYVKLHAGIFEPKKISFSNHNNLAFSLQ